jgi:hypothetical protein
LTTDPGWEAIEPNHMQLIDRDVTLRPIEIG